MARNRPVRQLPEPWEPPPATVSFVTWLGWRRWVAYVDTVGIWATQGQRRFRGWTEAEALEKAKAWARKTYPDAIVPDDPRVSRL